MLDLLPIVRHLGLDVGSFAGLIDAHDASQTTELTRRVLNGATDAATGRATDLAILHVLARSGTDDKSDLPPQILALVSQWVQKHWKDVVLVEAALAQANPWQLAQLFYQIVDAHPEVLAMPVGGSIMLDEPQRTRLLERIAADPRDHVREHLFALLGKHRRISPPGSLQVDKVESSALLRMLRNGIDDLAPKVRERAIAVAYGLAKIDQLGDVIMAHVGDEDMSVRQYAIVALGIATDPTSLAVLTDRLRHGARPEVASAIWALSRRKDGIDRILELAGSEPQWTEPEILGAFAEVATPMSDADIDRLRKNTKSADFERFLKRHLDRTRNGAPEIGPDARVDAIRVASPKTEPG